jgi:hypothetical protein
MESDFIDCLSGFPVLMNGDFSAKHRDRNSGCDTAYFWMIVPTETPSIARTVVPLLLSSPFATPDVHDIVVLKNFILLF